MPAHPYPYVLPLRVHKHIKWRSHIELMSFKLNGVKTYYLEDGISQWMDESIAGEWSMPIMVQKKSFYPRFHVTRLIEMSFENADDALAFEMKWL